MEKLTKLKYKIVTRDKIHVWITKQLALDLVKQDFGGKLLKGRPIYPGKNGSTSGEKEKNGEKKEKEKREKGEEAAGKKEKE